VSRAWKFVIAGVVIAALGGGAAWAASSSSAPSPEPTLAASGSPPTADRHQQGQRHRLFTHLSSAELTVTIAGTEHHIRIDRGTVEVVSSTRVVLKELDGSSVTIPIDSGTRIVVDGQEASISDVKEGYVGLAMRDGDNPARVLRVHDSQWPGSNLGTGASVSGP
jgi:hypothetical protein